MTSIINYELNIIEDFPFKTQLLWKSTIAIFTLTQTGGGAQFCPVLPSSALRSWNIHLAATRFLTSDQPELRRGIL